MKILILGGTTEAAALARRVAGDPRFDATISLAGVTRNPAAAPIPRRIGGFGGADGLAAHLRNERIDALVDATHPFATQITDNARIAAGRTGTPRLLLGRPPWLPVAGDRWTLADDMEQAAAALGATPLRVLLTVGRKDLAPFAARPWHAYVVRSVDPPPAEALPAGTELIAARGPFELTAERALLTARRIAVIVAKNSGGSATAAKLTAARELDLPVILVARPPAPEGATVEDAEAALAWLVSRHQSAASARATVGADAPRGE